MTAQSNIVGSRFFSRLGSVCACCALLATQASGQLGEDQVSDVNVSNYGTVDIAVQDTDLAQVLQMLAIQSRKNIITSKSVSASVTANLFDVTFYEALDSILRVNGYGYFEEGNFIYIHTLEELAELEQASRRVETRVFDLDYISATEANDIIAGILTDGVGISSYLGDVQPGFQPSIDDGGTDSWAFSAKLVVTDYPDVLERIANMLADLDSPPQQVLVEATILQTTLDEANAFGIDFSVIADMDFLNLTNPLAPVTNLLNGNDSTTGFQPSDNEAFGAQTSVGNAGGPGGLKIGIISNDVSVFLRVLDEVTDSTVLARPKVMVLNRQRAEILVGARVGYLNTTATETSTTQSVDFLDTGIHLIFRPFINKNGSIRMELAPSVSEASLRTVTDANGVAVTIPDELTNELTTNVRVHDGETLLLGGLFREKTSITRRQVPFLGDIPIIAPLFRGQDDTIDRDEIIFLITPSIIHDEKLWDVGSEMLGYADSVQVGIRNSLLPFSQDKMTANNNQRAMQEYRDGNLDRALFFINNSLRLHKNQPEIIKFREEITGEIATTHDRSLMNRAYLKRIGKVALGESFAPVPVLESIDEQETVSVDTEIEQPEDLSFVDPADETEMTEDLPMEIAEIDEQSVVSETVEEMTVVGEPIDETEVVEETTVITDPTDEMMVVEEMIDESEIESVEDSETVVEVDSDDAFMGFDDAVEMPWIESDMDTTSPMDNPDSDSMSYDSAAIDSVIEEFEEAQPAFDLSLLWTDPIWSPDTKQSNIEPISDLNSQTTPESTSVKLSENRDFMLNEFLRGFFFRMGFHDQAATHLSADATETNNAKFEKAVEMVEVPVEDTPEK